MDKGCNSRGSLHLRFHGLISIGLLAALLLGACAQVEPAGPYDPQGTLLGKDRHKRNTPPWARMQLSWGKLAAIENWLQGPSARDSEYWWVEGQLALNEGRAEFARQDIASGRADQAIKNRITTARSGFSKVKSNSRASRFQRERASRGLAVVQKLSQAEPKPPTTITLTRRNTWRARKGRKSNMTRSNNQFRRITVHHSADSISPQLDGSLGSSANALRRLQDVHMDGAKTGYGDIGYHFLIDPNGRLFEGRELAWQGAHAGNSNTNRENIGVCLLGNFEGRMPTPAALSTLERTLGDLRARYRISKTQVFGHMDFKNTLCPGRQLMQWVKRYAGR